MITVHAGVIRDYWYCFLGYVGTKRRYEVWAGRYCRTIDLDIDLSAEMVDYAIEYAAHGCLDMSR